MSKILKRPMFRKGGPTNEGVVSLAQPRRNYQYGSPEQLIKQYPAYESVIKDASAREALTSAFAGQGRTKSDRLGDLLISGGLNLMSARPRGNIFATAAESFKEPTAQLLKEKQEEDRFKRQIKLQAVTGALKLDDERTMKLFESLNAPEKDELMRRAQKYAEVYKIPLQEAQKIMLKRFVEGTPPKGLTKQTIFMDELAKLQKNPLTKILPADEQINIAKTMTEVLQGNAPNSAVAPYDINNLDKKKLTEFTIGKNYINPGDGFIYNLQNDGKFKKIWPSN